MESLIDERYRLLLLEKYLENAMESKHLDGHSKWQFICQFCSHTGKTEAKKKHRKAALLWNSTQHSWVFYCAKKGCIECMYGKTFSNLVSAINPALGEAYRLDRDHSGTTGKGRNFKASQGIMEASTRYAGYG